MKRRIFSIVFSRAVLSAFLITIFIVCTASLFCRMLSLSKNVQSIVIWVIVFCCAFVTGRIAVVEQAKNYHNTNTEDKGVFMRDPFLRIVFSRAALAGYLTAILTFVIVLLLRTLFKIYSVLP